MTQAKILIFQSLILYVDVFLKVWSNCSNNLQGPKQVETQQDQSWVWLSQHVSAIYPHRSASCGTPLCGPSMVGRLLMLLLLSFVGTIRQGFFQRTIGNTTDGEFAE